MKKKFLVGLATIISFCLLSQVASAKYLVPCWYNRPYLTVGIGTYHLDNPTFGTLTQGMTNKTLVTITNNRVAPIFHLAAGYRFYNCENSILSKIFGHQNKIELSLDYFNMNQTKHLSSLGLGRLWLIDGTVAGAFGRGYATNIYNSQIKAKNQYMSGGLFFKGHHKIGPTRMSIDPHIGLIHSGYNSKYAFRTNYDDETSVRTDVEEYRVKSTYDGIAAGGRFNFNWTPKVIPFADAELQLLYAKAKLKAYQNGLTELPSSYNPYIKNVENSDNAVTYRSIIALGISYKFMNCDNSPVITFRTGIDRWGYNPKIVTPNSASSGEVHLKGEPSNNFFASLELSINLVTPTEALNTVRSGVKSIF